MGLWVRVPPPPPSFTFSEIERCCLGAKRLGMVFSRNFEGIFEITHQHAVDNAEVRTNYCSFAQRDEFFPHLKNSLAILNGKVGQSGTSFCQAVLKPSYHEVARSFSSYLSSQMGRLRHKASFFVGLSGNSACSKVSFSKLSKFSTLEQLVWSTASDRILNALEYSQLSLPSLRVNLAKTSRIRARCSSNISFFLAVT